MSYLSNDTVNVDAILTKRGRELYANGRFSITKFALADDEIDYSLYDSSHPSGSDYYDIAITNLPMLEAIPDGSKMMRFKLITLPKGSSQIPLISVGLTSVNLRAPYGSYPGQSQTITPSTVNGLNSTLGYTATLSSNQYVNLRVVQSVPPVIPDNINFVTDAPIVATTGEGSIVSSRSNTIIDTGASAPGISLIGHSFILSAKAVPDNNVYTSTLRITGNETGGEVVVNIHVSRQTSGGVSSTTSSISD